MKHSTTGVLAPAHQVSSPPLSASDEEKKLNPACNANSACTTHSSGSLATRALTNSAATPSATAVPSIGDAWPGIDGIYAGVSRGENGEPDAHLVLLNPVPTSDLNWQAAIDWATSLGDGARLPTRFESALLYANLQDRMDTDRWHWTGTQYSALNAWYQDFYYGSQYDYDKKARARARAVRRLIL